jgi:hypothetical protein
MMTCDNPFHFFRFSDGTVSHYHHRPNNSPSFDKPPAVRQACYTWPTAGRKDICDNPHHTHPERSPRDLNTDGVLACLEAMFHMTPLVDRPALANAWGILPV